MLHGYNGQIVESHNKRITACIMPNAWNAFGQLTSSAVPVAANLYATGQKPDHTLGEALSCSQDDVEYMPSLVLRSVPFRKEGPNQRGEEVAVASAGQAAPPQLCETGPLLVGAACCAFEGGRHECDLGSGQRQSCGQKNDCEQEMAHHGRAADGYSELRPTCTGGIPSGCIDTPKMYGIGL